MKTTINFLKVIAVGVVIAVGFAACGGKKDGGSTASGGVGGPAASGGGSGGSPQAVKAGTPAPASDFTVELKDSGVHITGYNGSAKNLTIPATIEDIPVLRVTIRSLTVEQIFVPEGVEEIDFGDNSRYGGKFGCSNLRAISLPGTLKRIMGSGFENCAKLASITIPSGVGQIESSAFRGSGIQSIVIPSSVTFMGGEIFKDCKSLTRAEISGTDLKIGGGAFSGCDALQTVIINEGVLEIDSNVFFNCASLQTVHLPGSLTTIGNAAFTQCSSLATVAIPHGVIWIGENAFYKCTGLESVSIPNTVTSIRANSFEGCENLVTVEFEEGASIKDLSYVFNMSGNHLPKLSLKSQAAVKAASK